VSRATVRTPQRAGLAAAIASLPERDRLVLSLRLLEHLTSLETAAALRLTSLEVERRVASALASIARTRAPRRVLKRAA